MYAKVIDNKIIEITENICINGKTVSNSSLLTNNELVELGYYICLYKEPTCKEWEIPLINSIDKWEIVDNYVYATYTIEYSEDNVATKKDAVIVEIYQERNNRIQSIDAQQRAVFGKLGSKQYVGDSWMRFYQMLQDVKFNYLSSSTHTKQDIEKYNVACEITNRVSIYDEIADNAVLGLDSLTPEELFSFDVKTSINWGL